MSKVQEFIESGMVELYVLGLLTEAENKEVEQMCALHPEVNAELETISQSLLTFASKNAPKERSTVKPLIMATIEYTERIKGGEEPATPPILNENSTISQYEEWLNRADMIAPDEYDEIFIKLIASNKQATSAIVWIKTETPAETHTIEHEKFLIVEGSCDIVIDNVPHSLKPGDYMTIPLFANHVVKVTSAIPCKVVLQRVAA